MSNKTQPRTFVFEVRADIRDVATFALFMEENRVPVRSRSQIGAEALSFVANTLGKNGRKQFQSTAEAKDYLDNLELEGKQSRKVLHSLASQISLEHNVSRGVEQSEEEETTEDLVSKAMKEFGL